MNASPSRNPSSPGRLPAGPRRRTTQNRVSSSSAKNPPPGRASSSNGARSTAHAASDGDRGPATSNTTGRAARSSSALSCPWSPSSQRYSSRPSPTNTPASRARLHRPHIPASQPGQELHISRPDRPAGPEPLITGQHLKTSAIDHQASHHARPPRSALRLCSRLAQGRASTPKTPPMRCPEASGQSIQ